MTTKHQVVCPNCYAEIKYNRSGNVLYSCGTTFTVGVGYEKGCEKKFVPACVSPEGYGCDSCAKNADAGKGDSYCNTCQMVTCDDPESATPEQCRKCLWVMPKERR